MPNATLLRALALAASTLFITTQAIADTAKTVSVAAGDLADALEALAKQCNVDVIYPSSQLKGLKTQGVSGVLEIRAAFQKLIEGTSLIVKKEEGGSVLIALPEKSKEGGSDVTKPAASTVAVKVAQEVQLQTLQDTQPFEDDKDVKTSAAGPAQSADSKSGEAVPEMVVTGSHIRTLNTEVTAIPVFTIGREELERRGVNRLADIRWAIPQLSASIGFNDNLTNSGTSRAQTVSTSFNLRGLGGNSTLVLVNGRRVPHTGQEAPGGAGGREDFSIDGLPISAIERIDILPQGAGAAYGAEAIAGVINVILKSNYTGMEMRASYDTPFDTDVSQKTVSVTAGHRAGKLGAFVTASYEDQSGLLATDRWFTATADSRVFGSTSTSFLFNVASGAGTLSSNSSPALSAGANLPGQTTHVVGIPVGSSGSTTANNAFTLTTPPLFDSAEYSMLIDPAERVSTALNVDYALTDRIRLYSEGRWSRFENSTVGSPPTLSVSLPAGYPGNPFSTAVFLRKVFYDLPRFQTDSAQENMGFAVGLRSEFLKSWRYDISASWARNIVSDDAIAGSSFNFTLLTAAMNSTNRPLLAYDSLNGTDPNAPGVLAALLPVYDHKDTTDVYQYSAVADGAVWSGWAGDVRLAVGAEMAKEKVKFWREPGNGLTFLLSAPLRRESSAAFAELSVPLLSERQQIPLVHRFEIGGALRVQDYSDNHPINIPTVRALYQPRDWLTFRASRATGFKPVRLYDLLAPTTNFTSRSYTAADNLRDNQRGGELLLGPYPYSSGGNPNLLAERSVSRNIGMVIDIPGEMFKGLSMSVDYYKLDFNERSGGPSFQILFDYFPERVTRAAPTTADIAAGLPGRIVSWDATNINLSGVKTSGWDYRLTYQRVFGFGEVLLTVARSDSDPTYTQATPASIPSATFGHQPIRTSGALFWQRKAWDAGLTVNQQTEYPISGLTGVPYPKYIEFNPQVSYNFAIDPRFDTNAKEWWARWLTGTKVSLTVVNALNEEPETINAAQGRIVMDPRLRRYIASFSKSF